MINQILHAKERLQPYLQPTPCTHNSRLSKKNNSEVYLKREELQPIRSYKIRGALNSMLVNQDESEFICASAGNHAQGVAYSARLLNKHAVIVMPQCTPKQKVEAVKYHGGTNVEIVLHGNNYSTACEYAKSRQNGARFIHAFDDEKVIAGQGTLGVELYDYNFDYILLPIGGGGLAAGVASAFMNNPKVKIIGVQMENAASMYHSLKHGSPVTLTDYSHFVDGASVSSPGKLNFEIVKKRLDDVVLVNERQVCDALLDLYNVDGIVSELAGAMSVAALQQVNLQKGSKVCCILSGGNNDVRRMPQIIEKSSYLSN